MAITVQQTKKGGGISFIIILLILIIGGWLAFNLLKRTESIIQPKLEELLSPKSQEVISAQLDINKILNNPIFLSLTPHIKWPLDLPQLGKNNPFLPF